MIRLLTFLAVLLAASSAQAQRRYTVMTETNGVLLSPTNFFSTNRALLNAVVERGTASYSNTAAFLLSYQTNQPMNQITNAGTAAYSNATAFYLASNPTNYVAASWTNDWTGTNRFLGSNNTFNGSAYTNNGTVWISTNLAAVLPNAVMPNGSLLIGTNGAAYLRTNDTWTRVMTADGIQGVIVAISNGVWWSGKLHAPTFTNAINYGNAFSSPGLAGAAAEQFGTGASANNSAATAVGNLATASGTSSSAVGFSAIASGIASTALGASTVATMEGSAALGQSANSSNINATAIGYQASTTTSNQVRIGTSSQHVSIPGGLTVGASISNATHSGFTVFDGNARFVRKANTSLANGNNAGVSPSTNSFVEVSGPSADFTINGIADGADGRFLIILNQTGFNMTVAHQSGVDPTAANRIVTMTGADRVTTANGAATFIYSAAASRWILISFDP